MTQVISLPALSWARSIDFSEYDLPEDPAWMDQMSIRHAVAVNGAVTPAALVKSLDSYAESFGMKRHGKLEVETWNWGRDCGVAAHFAIYDLSKFVTRTRQLEAEKERRRIRHWPWWRRLFWPESEQV